MGRMKKSREEENTLILDILIDELKQRIENLWVEGCPFNIKCLMVEGNADKYCRSDGTMECGIYIEGERMRHIPGTTLYFVVTHCQAIDSTLTRQGLKKSFSDSLYWIIWF